MSRRRTSPSTRCGSGEPSPELLDSVAYALESYRRIGHDLVVGPARPVPLDIALAVCAAPGHQHGQILAELYRRPRQPAGSPADGSASSTPTR